MERLPERGLGGSNSSVGREALTAEEQDGGVRRTSPSFATATGPRVAPAVSTPAAHPRGLPREPAGSPAPTTTRGRGAASVGGPGGRCVAAGQTPSATSNSCRGPLGPPRPKAPAARWSLQRQRYTAAGRQEGNREREPTGEPTQRTIGTPPPAIGVLPVVRRRGPHFPRFGADHDGTGRHGRARQPTFATGNSGAKSPAPGLSGRSGACHRVRTRSGARRTGPRSFTPLSRPSLRHRRCRKPHGVGQPFLARQKPLAPLVPSLTEYPASVIVPGKVSAPSANGVWLTSIGKKP